MTYFVNNLSKNFRSHKYVVVRDCEKEVTEFYNGDNTKRYWYWCCYDDLDLAQEACKECGNGFIVESENIEALGYGGW